MEITEHWHQILTQAAQPSTRPKYVTVTLYGGQSFMGVVDALDDLTVTLKTSASDSSTLHIVDMHLIVAVTIRARYP